MNNFSNTLRSSYDRAVTKLCADCSQLHQSFNLICYTARTLEARSELYCSSIVEPSNKCSIQSWTVWTLPTNSYLYHMPDDNLLERHTENRMGGQVSICIKKRTHFHIREDLIFSSSLFDSIVIEIDSDKFRRGKIMIDVVYRPTGTDLEIFVALMKDALKMWRRITKSFTWWAIITLIYLIMSSTPLLKILLNYAILIHLFRFSMNQPFQPCELNWSIAYLQIIS